MASSNSHSRSAFLGKTGSDEAPLDRTYYQILNVSPTASSSEIKRAYYSLSLQYHPDRTQNLDDFTRRDYAERFKLISQAYTILSDPEKRTLYNRYGKDERVLANGSAGISLDEFDAEEFFRIMFGGEEFKDIIGDFELAKAFKSGLTDLLNDAENRDRELTPEEQEEKARQRQANADQRRQAREQRLENLSKNLIEKISIFTDVPPSNTHEKQNTTALNHFIEVIRTDRTNLLQAPYGEQLLHSIGYIYSSKARRWSSKMDSQEGHIGRRMIGFGKHMHSAWKEHAHIVKETIKTVKSAIQWGQSMSKLAQATSEDEENSPSSSSPPFTHHSGHLEYSGYTPPASPPPPTSTSPSTSPSTSSTATATPNEKNISSASSNRIRSARKGSAQPVVPLTEEQKRQLEADTAAKSMDALWRAVKLEIESVQRDVCDRVLNDQQCPRDLLRRRCIAVAKLGELWQETSSD